MKNNVTGKLILLQFLIYIVFNKTKVAIHNIVTIKIRTKEITWSSYKEHKGNALALGADEGRD